MKKIALLFLVPILISCNESLHIEGFDSAAWLAFQTTCTDYRLEIADHLMENRDVILEANQNEVEKLLGPASEHELYKRNQKFFHYRLTPADSCGDYTSVKYLSIRFNAIGRANDVQVIIRE